MSVEKFTISREAVPYAQLNTNVLQNLKKADVLGVWCYLSSLPPAWIIYKNQLCKHFNVGRDKMNKIFDYLESCNLIERRADRDSCGKFSHVQLHIKNGDKFSVELAHDNKLDAHDSKEENTNNIKYLPPLTENPLTDNQGLVISTYKVNKKKQNKDQKILSASSDAQSISLFDDFWEKYPVKKNKVRAQKIWKSHDIGKYSTKILKDIAVRSTHDVQWMDKKYIPHPSTYLLNEMWNDEIVLVNSPIRKNSTEAKCTVKAWGPGHTGYDSLHK